ncbi:MAG: mycofactocin-associated electron transfer flavoprotein alpha subunit [Ilumatobacteraceae bacterium]
MFAVLVVRDGRLPQGGDEALAECGGRVLLACTGSASDAANSPAALATALSGLATSAACAVLGDFEPGRWSAALAPLLADEPRVVLPGSPDGRDLAPRLAALLRRPLYAVATSIGESRIDMARGGGSALHTVTPAPAFVATLQPGVRGVERDERNEHEGAAPAGGIGQVPQVDSLHGGGHDRDSQLDARVLGTQPPDPASIDLSEAPRIVAGGAGLDDAARLGQVAHVAALIGASAGATRVVTDRGWAPHTRQIGTTGVVVNPDLYVAFGISGAVQHTAGLGTPEHVISVNTDGHCPMMQLADLAIVSDANETLDHLERLLADRLSMHPTASSAGSRA